MWNQLKNYMEYVFSKHFLNFIDKFGPFFKKENKWW
jgi:hypothetical protein